jgi:hypothetical protein
LKKLAEILLIFFSLACKADKLFKSICACLESFF